MSGPLRVASFTVHGTAHQSARWKQAAGAEGFASAGAWLACAADAYLKARARAGAPVPLYWRRGRFAVQLDAGAAEVWGAVSPPFATFRGTAAGRSGPAANVHTLVYLPVGRILATVRHQREARTLAADLARQWLAAVQDRSSNSVVDSQTGWTSK